MFAHCPGRIVQLRSAVISTEAPPNVVSMRGAGVRYIAETSKTSCAAMIDNSAGTLGN